MCADIAYGELVFFSLLIQPVDDKLHSTHIYRVLQKVSSYLLYNIYLCREKTSFETVETSETLWKGKSRA